MQNAYLKNEEHNQKVPSEWYERQESNLSLRIFFVMNVSANPKKTLLRGV